MQADSSRGYPETKHFNLCSTIFLSAILRFSQCSGNTYMPQGDCYKARI